MKKKKQGVVQSLVVIESVGTSCIQFSPRVCLPRSISQPVGWRGVRNADEFHICFHPPSCIPILAILIRYLVTIYFSFYDELEISLLNR